MTTEPRRRARRRPLLVALSAFVFAAALVLGPVWGSTASSDAWEIGSWEVGAGGDGVTW